jgi:hypothetical protein
MGQKPLDLVPPYLQDTRNTPRFPNLKQVNTKERMPLPIEFFQVNYAFGLQVSRVADLPLPTALQEWTNIPLRLGFSDTDSDGASRWSDYFKAIETAADPLARIYSLYLEKRQNKSSTQDSPEPTFGCFRYQVWEKGRIRLHFRDNDTSIYGPLSKFRSSTRKSELRALTDHAASSVLDASTVVGCSWLYSIETYRQLFPPSYLKTATPASPEELRYYGNWGQFLDHTGGIKQDIVDQFLHAIASAKIKAVSDLQRCFSCPILALEAPLSAFLSFYADEA